MGSLHPLLVLPRPIHCPFLCCITGKYTSQPTCQLASTWVWKGKCRRKTRREEEVKPGYFSMSHSSGVAPSQAVGLSLP